MSTRTKERSRELWKSWYVKNREYRLAYSKRYRLEHPDKAAAFAAREKIYKREHREEINAKRRKVGRRIRKEWRLRAIAILGNKCIVCGIDDPRILEVNHINGDGKKDRKGIGKKAGGGETLFRAIAKGKRPTDEFDLRCANHNLLYEYETGRRKW